MWLQRPAAVPGYRDLTARGRAAKAGRVPA